jgi:hypothetical protein
LPAGEYDQSVDRRLPVGLPPQHRRGLLKRWARRLFAAAAWSAVALLALFLSIVYHSQLPLTGVVVVEAATGALNREIRGELSIGQLENVDHEGIVARGVVVRDPQGREVIRIGRVHADFDWSALWGGTIRFSHVWGQSGEVTLYVSGEENETVSLVEGFLPRQPSNGQGRPPPHILVDGIVLEDVLVRGDVPGFAGMRYEDVRLTGRVETHDRFVRFSVFDGRGAMTGPYPGRTSIDRILGHFSTDMENEGLEFYARAHRGEDRIRARIRLTRPDLERPPILELRVAVDPVRIETLEEMGIAPGLSSLDGTFRGFGRLYGSADDLSLSADLTSQAGRVRIRGRLPTQGTLSIEAETERLRLDQLVSQAPRTTVAGRVRLDVEADEGRTQRVHAEVSPLSIDDFAIPGFTMDGVLEETQLRITGLEASHAGGETEASGTIGFDGSLDVHVSARLPDIGADPNVRRQAPGARGSLSADLDIRADDRASNLRFDGRASMRRMRYGEVRASRIDVRGHGSGELPAPTLRLEAQADDLRIGALDLGHAEVDVRGGPGGYDVDAQSRSEEAGTRFALRGRAFSRAEGIELRAPELEVDLGDGTWRGEIDVQFAPGRSVTLDPLALAHEDERIVVRGTYRFRGEDDLDVQLMNVELAHLVPLAPEALAGLSGETDARIALEGDLDTRPQGRVEAVFREGEYRGLRGVEGHANLELRGERLDTDVHLQVGSSSVDVEGPMRIPPSALRQPSRLLERAGFDGLRVRAENVDVGPLLAMAGLSDQVRITGRITTDAELTGSARRPGVRDMTLVLDQVLFADWEPLRAKLRMSLGEGRLDLGFLWVADSIGELATIRGYLPVSLDDLPRDFSAVWRTLRTRPWSLTVNVAPRRLDGLPIPMAHALPRGLQASANVTASGSDGVLSAEFEATGELVDAATDDPCAADLRPAARLRGRLDGDVVTGLIAANLGAQDRNEIEADVAAVLPLDNWVERGGVNEFPSTELVLRVRGAELGSIPWLCGYARGPVSGSLTAKDLLTGRSVLGAVVDLPRFQIWERVGAREAPQLSTEYRLHVRAGSSPERDALTACTILGVAGTEATQGTRCRDVARPLEGEMLARARVPVTWTPGQLLPQYTPDGTITSWAAFDHVHVEPVLTFIPGIVAGDAVVHGDARVRGAWSSLLLSGALDVTEGHLQIDGLGQHLYGVTGHVDLRGNRAIFPEATPLVARDAGGRASAWGRVQFEGLVPRVVRLNLNANDFPVRREGMVLARLSGEARITGEISDEALDSTIRTEDFDVRLPEQSASALQPLDRHSEILLIGEARPRAIEAPEDDYPVSVHVDATRPFWVRRNDFAAHVTADLHAVYRDPNLYVGGRARILRGTFEIFGKRFELQQGFLTFNPNTNDLDPTVNVVAIYEVPGRRGATVSVSVTGSLTNPVLEFASTETSDRAEIISLLVAGGRREAGTAERQASEEAASFLAGLTAGILTLGLRQEFGDVIPVLAIESEGLGGTRVRIGFNANDLIPDELSGVVTGMYIEGFATATGDNTNAGGSSSGTGGVGGGVTVELTFPYNMLVRGTYVPVDNGSLDFLIEP